MASPILWAYSKGAEGVTDQFSPVKREMNGLKVMKADIEKEIAADEAALATELKLGSRTSIEIELDRKKKNLSSINELMKGLEMRITTLQNKSSTETSQSSRPASASSEQKAQGAKLK